MKFRANQAREAELERTIADLGAALVVARNKEINRLKSDSSTTTAGERGGNDVSALRTRLEDTEDVLETIKAQLDLERQRVSRCCSYLLSTLSVVF